MSALLPSIEQRLDEHVHTIVRTALSVPPGGGRAWDSVLAHYRVTPDAAVERLRAVRESGQNRGASEPEVRRVLLALAGYARAEVDAQPIGPAEYAHREHLHRRLERLADEHCAKFLTEAGAAPVSSVGGVFANAKATAKMTPWANVKIDPATVMSCETCGAPQERALDFLCRYCRNPLFAKQP